jgi:2-keto-4-pentenoate hydratase/2-oxohepta-3-ene-1,7-dioic acid hydratase in catechol pathway
VTRLGALRRRNGAEAVLDLIAHDDHLPGEMLAFLAGGEEMRRRAQEVVRLAQDEELLPLAEVQLAAPVPRPGKIICVGLNYLDHAQEGGHEVPDFPTVFAKYANTVIGPGQPIKIPPVTEEIDYEGELGVVIGRRARNVTLEDALDYVAGYVPFNDVTAREYQRRTSQWTLGKTFDTFGPMGPTLVTGDELVDPEALDLRVYLNDQLVQDSNTGNLIFKVPFLVHYLSEVMTLEPGDLISTGTPSGVGFARKPPLWLRPGDTVRVEIEGLGILQNPVVAEEG